MMIFYRRMRQWLEKDKELTGVKVKWTQRVEDVPAKSYSVPIKIQKGHLMNIYWTDSNEEAIVDFFPVYLSFLDKVQSIWWGEGSNPSIKCFTVLQVI